MACTPYAIDTGLFITASPWETTPSKSFDGKTVNNIIAGTNPGISVQKGTLSIPFHSLLNNHKLSYGVLGNKYLLILDEETGPGPGTRTVSLVNFDTMTEITILTVTAMSNAIAPPVVNPSMGSGSAFLAYGQSGTEQTSVGIYRSDNGDSLCSIGAPIVATGQTVGEATAASVIIHYSVGGASTTKTCPKPLGNSSITPVQQNFSDVAIGGCPIPPPTKQFTIKNTGTDCLQVSPIAAAGPFSVQSVSKPLPVSLAKNEQVDVVIVFNPTTTGTWNMFPIPVTISPVIGDHQFLCNAKAVAAQFMINFSQVAIDFGKRPVGQSQSKSIIITNPNGSKPMTVSSGGVSADGFTIAAFSKLLNCGETYNVPVQFIPPSEGSHSANFSIDHQAPGSPAIINLKGEGCIANAEISVPPTIPLDFGQVQQSFRTVKFFQVGNPADGPLTFEAKISGPDSSFFGLPDPEGSVINPPQSRIYTVDPVSPCGALPAGSGLTVVAISFYAGTTARLVNATLTIGNHNATNFPNTQTWVFPLTAEITPPVALDVALVIDRSDSMNQALGSRIKIDAAIAASQLFVELLRPDLDDRVAVVRFNNDRNVVEPMNPVSNINPPTTSQIKQDIATNIPPATGLTAIAGGTMMGIHEVEKPHPGNPSPLNRAVIVLTDGIENTAFEEPPGNWLSLMGGKQYTPTATTVNDTVDTNPVTWPAGIDRYAIGIGKPGEVDPNQLNILTQDPQRVLYIDQDLSGTEYFQLEKYYTQIFMNIVGTQPIVDPMFWISPGDTHKIQFEILQGDVDALIVLYDFKGERLPFYCLSPKGEVIDPAKIPAGFQLRSGFTDQARIVEFKMPQKEPARYAGTWTVVIKHEGIVCAGNPDTHSKKPGFLPKDCRKGVKAPILYGIAIGVGSDFRMQPFVAPPPVYTGDPIQLIADISEAGLPVKGCNVTVEVTAPGGAIYSIKLYDDGSHADGSANDGEYGFSFTKTFSPGIYHFKFRSIGYNRDGQQVTREALRDKAVLSRDAPPPGKITPTKGKPKDGDRPPQGTQDCCGELLKVLREQEALLKKLVR